jgi:hypothetical protein
MSLPGHPHEDRHRQTIEPGHPLGQGLKKVKMDFNLNVSGFLDEAKFESTEENH